MLICLSGFITGAPLKPERPPCGPGPPAGSSCSSQTPSRPMSKSYSVDDAAGPTGQGSSSTSNGLSRSRQRSVSGHGSKKPPARASDDVLKRSRVQTGYELSQDLLDKQIEMLERKYGGVRARHAALTIQRAFRRYTLVKKFAAITAMAKAENKRLSRRLAPVEVDLERDLGLILQTNAFDGELGADSDADPEALIRNNFAALYRELSETLEKGSGASAVPPGVTLTSGQEVSVRGKAPRPTRALSLRDRDRRPPSPQSGSQTPNHRLELENLQLDNAAVVAKGQRGLSTSTPRGTHETESDLSDREMPSYSAFEESSVYYTPTVLTPCRNHVVRHSSMDSPSHLRNLPNGTGAIDTSCYYTPRESLSEDSGVGNESHLSRESIMRHPGAPPSMYPAGAGVGGAPPRSWRDASVWSTPQQGRASRSQARKVPPEVPKRTSSINTRSMSTEARWQEEGQGQQYVEHLHHHHHHQRRGDWERSCGAPSPQFIRSPSGGGNGAEPGERTGLGRSTDNGSMSSIQSSSSDSSSVSGERVAGDGSEVDAVRGRTSPVWKRKGQLPPTEHMCPTSKAETRRLANHTKTREVPHGYALPPAAPEETRHYSSHAYQLPLRTHPESQTVIYKVPEVVRKRQYRVGLNLFNKKPEKGILYLIQRGFLENSPQAVARFLISRKGLSKQMIGEYLGNLQNSFNMTVLDCFAQELDLAHLEVDVALRKFQTYFRMPGEAQKIERLMEVFGQRYCQCNPETVAKFRSPDVVFVLAFAIIMLNTDLHTPNLKPERRMKLDEFVKNLRGIDDGTDIDRDLLAGIYERVKVTEFKPGSDHVTQVMKVQQTIVGKKPNMALPHRRLVCYCRLYEIPDINKKERQGTHQREVFLFNDLLVITKIFSKKKNMVTYTFRQSFPLSGMAATLFEVPHYQYGIRLVQRVDSKVLITFNARNEHDRTKFVEDLRESISEMDEMENLRIEAELDKQKAARARASENRDSGVADVEVIATNSKDQGKENGKEKMEGAGLKRSALSNSLLDIHEQCDKAQRRGSVGSLDSGMSVSFQSTSASSISRDSSPQNVQGGSHPSRGVAGEGGSSREGGRTLTQQQSFLGGLFGKKERKGPSVAGRTEGGANPHSHSTEV